MEKHIVLVSFLVASISICITYEFDLTQNQMKLIKGRFCGSNLADTLSMICQGMYNSKTKRTMLGGIPVNKINSREDYEDNENLFYIDEPTIPFPYRTREKARALIPLEYQKRSRKPGIADECCDKSCSFFEMYSYCGK